MKPPSKEPVAFERGIVLMLFTLSLPLLLGLIVLGVDLGNLFLAREKLNLLTRSAAATAINIRALRGWAPLACAQETVSRGFECAETIQQPAPQGKDYKQIVQQVNSTLTSQIETLLPDAVTRYKGQTSPNALIQYGLPASGGGVVWSDRLLSETAPIYNLKTDTFQLKLRYGVKTILLRQLASLFGVKISSLCHQVSGEGLNQSERCWVEGSDSLSNSATTKARVIMLLDTSGSMSSKQQELKAAVASFIDYFNPFKDEIGIIPYGTGVKAGSVELGLFNIKGNDSLLQIKDVVAGLQMGGQTNPCDALIEAAAMIDRKRAADVTPVSTRTFVVLFTDGAPNVYRLRFCDPNSSRSDCKQPEKLSKATDPAAPPENDWYGWTVKWGRRDTAIVGDNPVYGAPKIKSLVDGSFFDTSPAAGKPRNFRINEKGEFMVRRPGDSWCNMMLPKKDCTARDLNKEPYSKLPYEAVFTPDPMPSAQNNYLWNGPSYLVNRRDQTSMGAVTDLIDRVDPLKYPTLSTTCGPPNRKGSTTTNADQFNYNHSLYFASRVLDRNWSLDGNIFNMRQDDAVYLTRPHPLGFLNPTNLTMPFYAGDKTSDTTPKLNPPDKRDPDAAPGCLDALDAEIPVPTKGVKLFVGLGQSRFWSNTDGASIGRVGEIIKTAELPYYCAIRTADYLRKEKNTTVFAVGLGEGARYKYGEDCWDPLQNALDVNLRKDFFLQRLSLAPEALVFAPKSVRLMNASWRPQTDFNIQERPGKNQQCTQEHPLQGEQVTIGFADGCKSGSETSSSCEDLPQKRVEPGYFPQDSIGGYYATSDPNALKAQFAAIAKQILFRLSI